VDFVALSKTGRTGAEVKPFVEPIQSLAAQEAAPVKTTIETPQPENAAMEQGLQPSKPSVKKPISAPKPKRKLQQALKLLAEGQSRRAVAKTIGVAESTLRAWLQSERVACVPS
jgi:hypothetical protein